MLRKVLKSKGNSYRLSSIATPIKCKKFRLMSTEATPPTVKSLTEQLAVLEHEVAQAKDKLLRTLAENENIRHHTAKEIHDNQEYAIKKFSSDLFKTADILLETLHNVPEDQRGEKATDKDLKNLYIGVEMVKKNLLKTFHEYGIEYKGNS